MNSEKYVDALNLLGAFMHGWYENTASSLVSDIFTCDARVDIPERGIGAEGTEPIICALEIVQEERNRYGSFRDIHLTHSPAYTELADGTCFLACDTYSFEPCKNEGRLTGKIEYFLTRMNIRCRKEEGILKIYKLFWRELQGMTPWDWDVAKHFAASHMKYETRPAPTGRIAAEDYLPVRNLAARFTQHNRIHCEEDFAVSSETVLDIPALTERREGYEQICAALRQMETMEKANNNMYICIPTLGSPYLYMEGDLAVSSWITMTFGVKGEAYGNSYDTASIFRSVGRTKVTCEKSDGQWKIRSYIYEPAYGFDEMRWTPSDRYNVMQCEEKNWREGPEKACGGTMADVAEIENLVADWTYGQRFEMPDFMELHMNIQNPDDLMVLITGSTREPNCGYEAVRKRLIHPQANDVGVFDRYEKTPGYHTGSTPLVEISEDGIHAEGAWIDFAMVDVGGLMGLPKYPKRYMITVGRYFHKFVKENGEWKQYFVGWDPLMNLPDMLYNPDISRGWICRQDKPFVFPPMFENFEEF